MSTWKSLCNTTTNKFKCARADTHARARARAHTRWFLSTSTCCIELYTSKVIPIEDPRLTFMFPTNVYVLLFFHLRKGQGRPEPPRCTDAMEMCGQVLLYCWVVYFSESNVMFIHDASYYAYYIHWSVPWMNNGLFLALELPYHKSRKHEDFPPSMMHWADLVQRMKTC